MCLAKKTGRTDVGGLDSNLKRHVLEFVGDEKVKGLAKPNPKWNAQRLAELGMTKQLEFIAYID